MRLSVRIALPAIVCLFVGCGSYAPVQERVTHSDPATGAPPTTNFYVNPAWENTAGTVRTVNRFVPSPAQPFIELGLSALLGGLAAWAKLKNSQRAAIKSVIVEVSRSKDQRVKENVRAAIEKNGLGNALAGELRALAHDNEE